MKTKKIAMLMVIGCSILGAIAQLSFKLATSQTVTSPWHNIFLNRFLLLGYTSYGISTFLLTVALKKGELSLLYPFIALTFVWVVVLSPVFFETDVFHEARFIGVLFIVTGVSFIGMGSEIEN